MPVISKLAAPGTQRHQDALAVLDATRSVVARGWTQRTWFVMETPRGRRRLAQRFFPTRLDHRRVVEACLVGAVVHGARFPRGHRRLLPAAGDLAVRCVCYAATPRR